MSPRHVYMPIIKGKLNDIKAFGKLSDDVRTIVKPLIEIMPVDRTKTTVDEHIRIFTQYLTKHCPCGDIFVDFYGLMPDDKTVDGSNAIIAGFRQLIAINRVVTPTYGFDRNDEIWPDLKKVVGSFGQGICFRVSIDDLDDHGEETWTQIIERAADLNLKPSDVDIVIDLRYIGDEDEQILKELVVDFLALNSNVSNYRSIVVAGSSALKTVSNIEKEGIGEIFRKELNLWENLRRDIDEAVLLLFGDYGVVHPDFSDIGSFKYANAKIRYTSGNHILYFRGHGLRHPVKDYEQYHELAAKVSRDKRYQGKDASFGDSYIFNCSQRSIKHGAPSTWIVADMNHHISYTALQTERLVVTLMAEQASESRTT